MKLLTRRLPDAPLILTAAKPVRVLLIKPKPLMTKSLNNAVRGSQAQVRCRCKVLLPRISISRLALLPIANVLALLPGCVRPLMTTESVIIGKTPLPVLPTLMVLTPAPGILNVMMSLPALLLARLMAPRNEQSFGVAVQAVKLLSELVSTTKTAAGAASSLTMVPMPCASRWSHCWPRKVHEERFIWLNDGIADNRHADGFIKFAGRKSQGAGLRCVVGWRCGGAIGGGKVDSGDFATRRR